MKMNPEIKKLWVDALRSGDYKQGVGRLRNDDNEFCCLGVLCNLHAQNHPEIAKTQTEPSFYISSAHILPAEVSKWAGLGIEVNPVVSYKKKARTVAEINDGQCPGQTKPATFKQIADVIEKQLQASQTMQKRLNSPIYFLSEYNWMRGIVVGEGSKNYKIYTPDTGLHRERARYIPKVKCADPKELVCIVWETWRGVSGAGAYRVERVLYPDHRIPAERVGVRIGAGRLTESAYGKID